MRTFLLVLTTSQRGDGGLRLVFRLMIKIQLNGLELGVIMGEIRERGQGTHHVSDCPQKDITTNVCVCVQEKG